MSGHVLGRAHGNDRRTDLSVPSAVTLWWVGVFRNFPAHSGSGGRQDMMRTNALVAVDHGGVIAEEYHWSSSVWSVRRGAPAGSD